MSTKRKRILPGAAPSQAEAPRTAGARRGLGIVLVVLGIAGGAVCFYGWKLKTPPLPVVATAQLDETAARQVEQYLNAVRAAPRSGAAWGKLGALLKSLQFREEARQCLAIAERLDPKEPRWPYLHGSLLASQSPAEAIALIRRAVELCGNEPAAPRLRLAKLLAESGQGEEARRQLEAMLRARPDQAPARLALAHLAQARGDLTEAVSLASACSEDRRTARAAWTLLGLLHQRLGDTNAAQQASRQAAALPPDDPAGDPFEAEASDSREDPRSLSDQAQKLLMTRKTDEAAPLIRRLIQNHPQFSEGWLLLGRMQFLQKDLTSAEHSIGRHLELEPESVNGHFQLGMVRLGQERYAEAVNIFEKTLQLKPDLGPGQFNLGFALAKSGRPRDAVAPFREALRLNPEYFETYLLLADLYLQLGQRAEASALVDQAQLLEPGNPRLRILREKLARP